MLICKFKNKPKGWYQVSNIDIELDVIHRLEHMSRQDLLKLQRDVKERLALFCEK